MTAEQDLSAPQIEWPDEIWAECDFDGGFGIYRTSFFATVDQSCEHAKYVHHGIHDSLKKYHATMLENGQLITLADHDRAVQAAVAKAVEVLTVDIAVVQAELRVALGGCDANGGWSHRPISIPSAPKDIFCQDCGEMLDKATAKRHTSAAANRTPTDTTAAIRSRALLAAPVTANEGGV